MQTVFIVAILLLGFLITFQIAKASEYVAVLRGEEKAKKQTNKVNAFLLLAFLILGLIGVYYCNETLKGKILGEAASNHGKHIDTMLQITLVLTGIVFVITQVALFWFAYKYQQSDDRKAYYYPHNNKLEVIWTVIPAIALTVLVGFGIFYWFKITGDAPKDAMEVEIIGSQFKWEFRYPGHDGPGGKGVFGKKYFKNITGDNPLGQIWDDPANRDDVYVTGEPMHLVVNKPVRLVINSKDVIHDVGLVHFRMKMDAVPGTPTTMWFTPTKTSKQMAQELGKANFVYEISCDQMCGKGHTGMRGEVIVETQEQFDAWMATKQPLYDKLFVNKPAVTDSTHTPDSTAKSVTAVLLKK
ncbi:MAG: cytochrome c oxidase subunit II [Bacteroidetes bacterium]|jgi:cytochrome c oxidase subunit 2|nr:MAG: cytochrome c oxidase subunit II [Bacteroidota bacterium]